MIVHSDDYQLTTEQVEALLAPLDPRRVRQVQGNSHLEAWDIRRHLLRVFGWGGWDFEVLSCDCILERSKWDDDSTHKGRHTVAYRVTGRLTIKSPDGNPLAKFEDGATGDAANQPSFADAHDMALKTAMSQCLKRCAVNLGDRFGLSLYNDGGTSAVVGKSLAHTSQEREASDHVNGGELAQVAGEANPNPAAAADGDLPRETSRQERAAQALEDGGLVDKAERMREKVAAGAPADVKARAAGGGE